MGSRLDQGDDAGALTRTATGDGVWSEVPGRGQPVPATSHPAPPATVGIQPGRITLGATEFLADPAGTLFHSGESTLLVADLHLEKGSSFARRGMMLPPYDTVATLAALAVVLARYRPRRVIARNPAPSPAHRLCSM